MTLKGVQGYGSYLCDGHTYHLKLTVPLRTARQLESLINSAKWALSIV